MRLEELSYALRGTSDAKMRLAGLDEEYARSQALRDKPMFTKPNEYGYLSPLGVLGDMIAHSRGRQMARDLKPQREAARLQIAEGENAPALYQAKVAADAAKQSQSNWENEQFQQAALQQEQQAHQVMLQQAKDAEARKAAEKLADAKAAAAGKPVTFVAPDGDPSTIVTGYPTEGGGMTDNQGNLLDVSKLVPYEQYTQQIKALKSGSGDDEDPMATVADTDLVLSVLGDEYLDDAVGAVDPERWAGKFGWTVPFMGNEPDKGAKIQALHSRIDDIRIDTVKDNLEGLGINPTDKDLAVAFESVPDKNTQPLAWAMWARDQYIPMLKKGGAEGIKAGTITQAKLDAYIARAEKGVNAALNKYATTAAPEQQKPAVSPKKSFIREDERAEYEAWKREQGLQ